MRAVAGAHLVADLESDDDGHENVVLLTIRNYLVAHTDFMVSDSTGLPVRVAKAEGFAQDTYGTFVGPSAFGFVNATDSSDLKRLFLANPHVEVPFRYGYPDQDHHGHIVVTRRPAAFPAAKL